jgi:hypothetical protein
MFSHVFDREGEPSSFRRRHCRFDLFFEVLYESNNLKNVAKHIIDVHRATRPWSIRLSRRIRCCDTGVRTLNPKSWRADASWSAATASFDREIPWDGTQPHGATPLYLQ